jgi:hypothetical protein
MSQKMQQLLDLIVNEEMDKANELFHEIVVEKSREIYENMIAEEADEDEEEMDESAEEDEEETDESVDEGFGMEADDETSMELPGGDETDDFVDATADHDAMGGDDEMGGDGSAPATKDDVQDLEDALAELKAEFAALTGGSATGDEEGDEFGGDEEGGEDNPFGDEEGDEEADSEDDETDDDEEADESMGFVREYRETVGNDWNKNSMKTQGQLAGAGTGEKQSAPVEGKSAVSSGKGKPTTGANAKNIAQAGKGVGEMSGTSTNADKGSRGLVGATKGEFTKGVEKNISSSSKPNMKSGSDTSKQGSGYPGNNKTAGPVGSGTGDKAGQTSVGQVKSPINGAPNRNA